MQRYEEVFSFWFLGFQFFVEKGKINESEVRNTSTTTAGLSEYCEPLARC